MKTMHILLARCLYSKVPQFNVGHYYEFSKDGDYTSYSVYKYVGVVTCYATRLLDECNVLVIEGTSGVFAVFEVC